MGIYEYKIGVYVYFCYGPLTDHLFTYGVHIIFIKSKCLEDNFRSATG